MSIIDYRDCNDIDVQFEDGFIVASKRCKKGRIKKSNYSLHPRVGETNTANNGQKMTIIAYRDNRDIDIQFEDGTIVANKAYSDFKNGSIKNPNFNYKIRVGETNIAKNGQKMTILYYRSYTDINVQFEDGTIVTNKSYKCFKKGEIRNPNFYNTFLGETNIAKNGQKMTIISYRRYNDIDVQFEDGTIVVNKAYMSFKRGEIKNPNYNTYKSRVGETNIANNGLKMVIVSYRSYKDIGIQFEDGAIVTNKAYASFKMGSVLPPSINSNFWGVLKDHKLFGVAYRLKDKSVYYYCECTKCGKKDILSPQQVLNHKCEG